MTPPPTSVDSPQPSGAPHHNGTTSTDGQAALRVSYREEDSMNLEPSMSGKSVGGPVGLIIPPPEIRAIVDKTADFVARNGIEFENKIKEREATNNRFNFLSPTDPYHSYYRHKVAEFEASGGAASVETAAAKAMSQLPEAVKEHIKRTAEFVPKTPPKPYEFCADPATINAFDLDLIRLTAMFVARNGRQFLTQLMNREVRNYQFDFLKPAHSNFPYFNKLVEQYTKVIVPPKNIVEEIQRSSTHQAILEEVRYRVGWEKYQQAQRDRETAEEEKEKLAYAQIDWHDFVVVQTVDFQPSETMNLPPLCTPKDVGTRILLQQRTEAARVAADGVAMEMESESEEEEEEEEEERREEGAATEGQKEAEAALIQQQQQDKQHAPYEVTQPAPGPPTAANVVIRDYDPKKATRGPTVGISEKYIISPLTNERIPADKLREHVRYSTVDPQYKEQRDREQMERQDEDPTNASGTEISRNIAKLAERRTDIFGVGVHGAEQTVIGKRLGEEERVAPRPEPKSIWDGQLSTIDATTRAAQEAKSVNQQLDQQISDLQKLHGFVVQDLAQAPRPPVPRPPAPAVPTPSTAPGSTTAASSVAPPPLPAPMPPMTGVGPGGSRMMLPPQMPRPPYPGMPPMLVPGMPPLPGMPSGLAEPPPRFFTPPSMPGAPLPPSFQPPLPPPMMGERQAEEGMPGADEMEASMEPPAKRVRAEETLEPEGVWLSRISGSITITILPPSQGGGETAEASQPQNLTIDITTMIGELKGQIQERMGVPASKVKLAYEGMFMKDNFSLAYYNMVNRGTIQLHLKERGGRKK